MEGPRSVRPSEVPSLVELMDEVFRAHSDSSMGEEYPQLVNDDNLERLQVFVDKGRVVAHIGYILRDASLMGCQVRVGCIGAVCTQEAYRGRGLATQLLRRVIHMLRDEGGDYFMISGGRGLYRRHSAVTVGCELHMALPRAALDDLAGEVEAVEHEGDDFSELSAAYEREPVRFLRPLDDWLWLRRSRTCMNKPARVWRLEREGQFAAYAVARRDLDDGALVVLEFAGDRAALVAGLRALADANGGESVRLAAAPWDAPLLAALQAAGSAPEPKPLMGTHLVVNFPQLFRRLRPWFAGSLGMKIADTLDAEQQGERVAFRVGDARVETSLAEATEILFGQAGGEPPELARTLGPLQAALPVPSLHYGLNYV